MLSGLWFRNNVLGHVIESYEGAQGNVFEQVELGLVGSCRVRLPKETHSFRSSQVV